MTEEVVVKEGRKRLRRLENQEVSAVRDKMESLNRAL